MGESEESEEKDGRLAALLVQAGLGTNEVDPRTGLYVRVSQRFCDIVGYTRDELLARGPRSISHSEDAERDRSAFDSLRAGSVASVTLEKRYVRPDGGIVWVRVTASGSGPHRPGGMILGVVEDVTERRAADTALRLQTSALQAAANGIVITDTKGTVQWVNDAFSRLTGYAAEEVLGGNPRLLRSGAQSDAFYREMWDAVLAGRTWQGQLVNRRKDGSLYSEEMTITPVRDAHGTITHFIAIKQDVTERTRHEEALHASEERYRLLVDNLDEVVFSVDLAGVVTFVSHAISRLGYRPDEVVGRPMDDFIHPEDRAIVRRSFASRLAGVTTVKQEARWLDASGRVHFLRNTTRPLLVGGSVVGLAGLATDVTEQRETEEQLRAAQRMEAIGRLAGGVAHDFNNMLSVILSYTELAVADLREEDPLRGDLCEVIAAAKRAEGLTRQLLAFSRRQVLQPEPVDLGALVEGLSKMLRRLIGEDVELRVAAAESLFLVKVDRGQIEQVVMNLAVNARDAMPEGGQLRVAATNVTLDGATAEALDVPPGDYVDLTVADTGHGMSASVRARIFEPFFTTKGVGKGTGLGLSMVHGILKQSGGGISVDTAPGRGTTFHAFLPRHVGALSVLPTRPGVVDTPGGRESVLVVEDESALRKVVKRVLAAEGYEVHVAANAGEALLICERHGAEMDLVLTDVVMPGMSGPELALRLAPLCPSARMMFMSGYTDEMLEHHDMLGQRFLRKPFDNETLVRKVRDALDEA